MAVLQAAYDILAEDGLGGLTIEAVARRAGVGRPMIYRRWQNKGTLAVACFQMSVMPSVSVPLTGNPTENLRQFIVRSITVMSGPAGRIFGSIVAEAQRDQATSAALEEHYLTHRTRELASLIDDGKAKGAFSADFDTDVAVTLILGSILQWLLMTDRSSKRFEPDIIAVIFRALGANETHDPAPESVQKPNPVIPT